MSSERARVWIVDDDASIRRVLDHALAAEDRSCRSFESAEAALGALADEQAPDAVLTDLRMPGASGDVLIERIDAPVIVMSAYADLDSIVDALKRGAFDFLPKPFDIDEVIDRVDRALASSRDAGVPPAVEPPPGLIGESLVMRALFRAIGRLAGSSLSVLLRGESGSGKERIARALHASSPRAGGPFVALNVAALPADLLESELFGHEKGAFSGAEAARAGYFEQADGGTLFLDEIGEMPTALQSRLLRVLDDGVFYRLGGRAPVRVDARIVAATHRDLEQAVASGGFREDLFHRLNVVPLTVPPLRERPEDIGPLLDHFLARAAAEVGDAPRRLTAAARERLQAHPWPGNVRELVNRCRRWTALVPGPRLDIADLDLDRPAEAVDWTAGVRAWVRARLAAGDVDLMGEAVARLERALIDEALRATGGRRAEAADRLGIGRNTLARKLDD
ncbi:nitrogen regulation protein NR(I) [Wenzhouxiangella sp. XN79A]|uniref:nitrogen regulation protein NR(I) n=1 Tax=Wenzhouxiangella sp. XN79A TaxID=2724193 RepID=UPI00144A9C71|nr:nitrogen regulation protein NR(I) [Wenzhouxiangella sp. XN79A]NKI34842.1 nitrogen regulation protein NR(I) [Wenzhouxiangella sp. XN79A]